MNRPTDDQFTIWAKKIRRSNQKAFDELFRSFYPVLVRFAVRYLRDKTAAKDVVQDCFVTLWKKRGRIDPEKSLKSYLFTMVRNRSLNDIRDRSATEVDHEFASSQPVVEPAVQDEPDGQPEKLRKKFENWINELPERQREAFQLSRFEGLDHQEIARVMELSPKTVNNHIVAALGTLKECYAQYQQQDNLKHDV